MSNQPTTEEQLADAQNEILRLQTLLENAQHALLKTESELARRMRMEAHRQLTTARTWPEALHRYQTLMQQYDTNLIGYASGWFSDQAAIAETAALELVHSLDTEELNHAEAQVIDLRAKAIAQAAETIELRVLGNPISHAMRLIPEDEEQLTVWLRKLIFV